MSYWIKHSFFLYLLSFGLCTRDPVSEQLTNYNKTHTNDSIIQTRYGAPVDDVTSILTAGPRGPALLQDVIFLDIMSHFDRERIPERVVHAKGAGAFGYFEVTHDITNYTKAVLFDTIGKRTNIAVRFSTVSNEKGGADTERDVRGFSIKFYTEDGIWDLVGNNTPIFFIRDPLLFPLMVHSQKRNPVTNIKDKDMFWDFATGRPETAYQLIITFTDAGTPDGYRYMHGFGSHTFKMVNAQEEPIYVKFHFLSDQGVRNLTNEQATTLAGTDPDYSTRDLYNAIALGDYPSWTFYIQVMTFEEAERFRWNPFDLTKIWPEDEYPLMQVGRFELNENPTNYFADVEQMALSPANLIPGIEPSPDKVLHGRLFSYSDTQRYRLGTNHLQIPVNRPFGKNGVTNYERDGPGEYQDQGGAPNYFPNSFGGPQNVRSAAISKFSVTGDVERYNSSVEDNFGQATMHYNSLSLTDREHLASNLASSLKGAAPFLQERATMMFSQVSTELGLNLKELLA